MGKDFSLTIAGDFGPAATKLVEVCAQAVGGLFKPYQMRRVAKAEAEAAIIQEQGQIVLTELHQRAIARFVGEEANKQENMEQIISKALPQVNEQAQPDNVEKDWVANFFDKCRIVSDDEMHTLWAKVLAGEANAPGTYSKRAVNLLASFDKRDAELFTRFCSFVWSLGGATPLVFALDHEVYKNHGIAFIDITHLANIGLVTFEPLGGYNRQGLPERVGVSYFNQLVLLEFQGQPGPDGYHINVGHAILTAVGEQLAKICPSKPVPEFFDYVIKQWGEQGLRPSSPWRAIDVNPKDRYTVPPVGSSRRDTIRF